MMKIHYQTPSRHFQDQQDSVASQSFQLKAEMGQDFMIDGLYRYADSASGAGFQGYEVMSGDSVLCNLMMATIRGKLHPQQLYFSQILGQNYHVRHW